MDLTLAICTYNKSAFIEETLGCVMAQTMTGFSLLIVDDASTDDTVAVIERFFERNPRPYKLIRLSENHGIGYCRHFAERTATTRYMMFLDSDDLLEPDAIEKMWVKLQSDSRLMAVGCYMEYIDAHSSRIGGGLYLGDSTVEGFYERAKNRKLFFLPSNAIYDRQAALSVGGYRIDGFPEGSPRYQDFCEDLDLWTRMSDLYVHGKAIVVVPEVLAYYRKAGTGLSAHTMEMLLKMRWVKHCLVERREGREDPTFEAWLAAYPPESMRKLRREAKAVDQLRFGVFRLHRRNPLGVGNVVYSIFLNPGYLIDKLKQNFLAKRRR